MKPRSRTQTTPLSNSGQGLCFSGMRVARDARTAEERPLCIADGRFVGASKSGNDIVELGALLALPGLINAHDHLEFALFPRLGGARYRNAREWAESIYRPSESPIREHLSLSKTDRLTWGGLRNLFGGVTTVCHHNPYEPDIFGLRFPVRVAHDVGWAHSLAFADDVAPRFAATPEACPFAVHAAEGVDQEARGEIEELDGIGVLTSRTVLVHALACGEREWALLRERGCGVVWCPSSNLFLFGRTLPPEAFRSGVPIALGTDSPLTAAGGFFEELSSARSQGVAGDDVYRMATETPARLLHLATGWGTLDEGAPADWIGLRDPGCTPCEALLDAPELEIVVVGGEIKLLSDRLARDQPALAHDLSAIRYGDRNYRVRANVEGLLSRARAKLGTDIRLGGVPVAEAVL